MKIIQITGRSNSGKTTFIKHLIPELKQKGSVAVVKHLADHSYHLNEGKDTTIFFENGADISVGIDSQKAVITTKTNDLQNILQRLYDNGITYAIIEGFKQHPYHKIVIGDLNIENCILKNPTVEEVIQSLDRFDNFEK
jgi:molybdopterin-guanine dinucleotide biosynthesis protein MobB